MSPSRSITERVISTGAIQATVTDAGALLGLVLVGAGIFQISHPATLIYAGVVCLLVSVLVALDRRARAAAAERQR